MTTRVDMVDIFAIMRERLPYSVDVNSNDYEVNLTPPYQWCRERFGPELLVRLDGNSDYYLNEDSMWDHYNVDPVQFCFKNPEDALLFKLTWGG